MTCVLAWCASVVTTVPWVCRCCAVLKPIATAGAVKTATLFACVEACFATLLEAWWFLAKVAAWSAVVKTAAVALTWSAKVTSAA